MVVRLFTFFFFFSGGKEEISVVRLFTYFAFDALSRGLRFHTFLLEGQV